jgi:hypothetical protein
LEFAAGVVCGDVVVENGGEEFGVAAQGDGDLGVGGAGEDADRGSGGGGEEEVPYSRAPFETFFYPIGRVTKSDNVFRLIGATI